MLINNMQNSIYTNPYIGSKNIKVTSNKAFAVSMKGINGVPPVSVLNRTINVLKGYSDCISALNKPLIKTKRFINIYRASRINPKLKAIFEQIKDLEGEEFVRKAYEATIKHFGYEGAAPTIFIGKEKNNVNHFNFIEGKIVINKKALEKCTKQALLKSIWHEFQHFIQLSDIYRTEGIDIQAIAQANGKSYIKTLQAHKDICIEKFGKPLNEFSAEEVQQIEMMETQRYLTDTNCALYDSVIAKKGIIKRETKGAKKTERYLKAIANYIETGNIHSSSRVNKKLTRAEKKILKNYRSNPLEIEARAVGNKICALYELLKQSIEPVSGNASTVFN